MIKAITALVIVATSACELDTNSKSGPSNESEGSRHKSVVVHTFTKLKAQPFNFDTDIPTMLALSNGVLYTATTGTKHLHTYKVADGNESKAWVQLDDFQGSHATANFDLNAGTRIIERMIPVRNGVAVAVSEDSTAAGGAVAGALGVAVFVGQSKKAESSVRFFASKNDFATVDLKEVTASNGEPSLYTLLKRTAGANKHIVVMWSNRHQLKMDAEGFDAVAGEMAIKFAGLPIVALTDTNNGIEALSALPDQRIALAKLAGLLTVAKTGVGKTTADNPLLEQTGAADVFDAHHKDQFKSSTGLAPTEIGAMALVGQYLIIGFVDDGSKNGGIVYADVTKPNFSFSTNLSAPDAKVKKIVIADNEARIVAEDAVYAFRQGRLSVEFNGKTLKKDRARVNTGAAANPDEPDNTALTYDTFKGGNSGEIPDDGTQFFDAAPAEGFWFYATDKGIYLVKTTTLSKTF